MADKPKVVITWLGGCGGCDEAIVDLNEVLLKVTDAVNVIFWPIALDFKYHHLEAIADGEITLSIINGNIRNSEHEEVARLLRTKSRLVLAFGACACFGGTPGMADFISKQEIFDWVYRDSPTVVNPKKNIPQPTTIIDENKRLTLPEFYEKVFSLNQIINVDYYLPGCPPPPDLIANAITAVLENKLPPVGSTLAPHKALCDSCPRNTTKPDKIQLKEIRRVHEVEANPETCFLTQGIICLGIATRDGCGSSCINTNMPCRGCFGPVEGVKDSGMKFISTLASIIDIDDEAEMQKVVNQIGDLAGYLYRFSLPSSQLVKIRNRE